MFTHPVRSKISLPEEVSSFIKHTRSEAVRGLFKCCRNLEFPPFALITACTQTGSRCLRGNKNCSQIQAHVPFFFSPNVPLRRIHALKRSLTFGLWGGGRGGGRGGLQASWSWSWLGSVILADYWGYGGTGKPDQAAMFSTPFHAALMMLMKLAVLSEGLLDPL